MANLTERQLFSLESVKMILYRRCDKILGVNFADLDVFYQRSSVVLKLYLFRNSKLSKLVTDEVSGVMKDFCPSLNYSLHFSLVSNEKNYPKYYFVLFYNKYVLNKVPAFSVLTRLQRLVLPDTVLGLSIRVRGKRGARKDMKSLVVGDVSKHSLVKGKLRRYEGRIETPMGTTGVLVTLMMKNHEHRE